MDNNTFYFVNESLSANFSNENPQINRDRGNSNGKSSENHSTSHSHSHRSRNNTSNHLNESSATDSEQGSDVQDMLTNKVTGNKIQELFDTTFTYSKMELTRLIDANILTSRTGGTRGTPFGFKSTILGISDTGNQNSIIQELKTALKTVLNEIDILRQKCVDVELEYRDITISASFELQKSLNILYKLQQKTAKLEEAERYQKKLSRDIMSLRDRLATKEKERRLIELEVISKEKEIRDQSDELISLRAMLGGSAEELNQQSIDAKLSVKLQRDLSIAHERIHSLESELSKKRDDVNKLQSEIVQLSVSLASSTEERMRQVREVEETLRKDLHQYSLKVRELEDVKLSLTEELTVKKEEVQSCNRDLSEMKSVLTSLQDRLSKVLADAKLGEGRVSTSELLYERDLKLQAQQKLEKERAARVDAQNALAAAEREWDKLSEQVEVEAEDARKQIQELTRLRDVALAEVAEKDSIIIELQEQAMTMKETNEISQLKALNELKLQLEQRHREQIRVLEEADEREALLWQNRFKETEMKLMEANTQIRTMHNLIQELRGNIRVFARIRPLLSDGPDADTSAASSSCLLPQIDGTSLKIIRTKVDSEGREPAEHSFSFDKIFGPETSQSEVFTEVSEFVQSALDGHRVCLFSYGQTGSGKTHTMQGYGAGNERGIIPRAIEQVGLYMDKIAEFGWEYTMEISFVEIYNETVRDLLRSNDDDNVKLDIVKDSDGNMVVKDVTMVEVDPHDSGQISSIMAQAARMRNVGATAMNSQSSRSHAIFCLHLHGINNIAGQALEGSLSLVDLAGSERLDRSNVTGDRLKETQAINKSLSCLADVFLAIANKQNHIPFRNSKLTYLLQPALSGTGKTLMMVNLSPTEESYLESLCSLRFANQVSQCVLGPAQKNIRSTTAEKGNTPPPSRGHLRMKSNSFATK